MLVCEDVLLEFNVIIKPGRLLHGTAETIVGQVKVIFDVSRLWIFL
jgi:hypothetical protein